MRPTVSLGLLRELAQPLHRYLTHTVFDLSAPSDPGLDCLSDWRTGVSLARIIWQDELGEEHLVATEQAWAREQLAVIEREPGYRLVSCVVDSTRRGP